MAAFRYEVDDFPDRTPDVVVAVFPYVNKSSFDYSNRKSLISVSEAMMLNPTILLDPYITGVQVTSGKKNHVSQVSISFKDDTYTIPRIIAPGDWMMVWITNDKKTSAQIRKNILAEKQSNGFYSGLKFVGKVQALRRTLSINQQTGNKIRTYTIMGGGFTELDTSIYFDPILNQTDKFRISLFQRLENGLNQVNTMVSETAVNKIVPQWINIFMGSGPGEQAQYANGFLRWTHNDIMVVPERVGKILGTVLKESGSNQLTYSSILHAIYGLQEYPGDDSSSDWGGFIPKLDSTNSREATQCWTPSPLFGRLNPFAPQLVNVPFWSLLKQYANEGINEMYTCLRVWRDGSIQPTFIFRQIPFTTDLFDVGASPSIINGAPTVETSNLPPPHNSVTTQQDASGDPLVSLNRRNARPPQESRESKENIKVTRFTSLPRWVVPSSLIVEYDTTKSNSMRINFVQVRSISNIGGVNEEAYQRSRVAPTVDQTDISRNGLSALINTMATSTASTFQGGNSDINSQWSLIVGDFTIGSELKWSGSLTAKGIQEPICQGDNVEVDGLIFHIENVTHIFMVDPMFGRKTFSTTLLLSNGVPADGSVVPDLIPPQDDSAEPTISKIQAEFTGDIWTKLPNLD